MVGIQFILEVIVLWQSLKCSTSLPRVGRKGLQYYVRSCKGELSDDTSCAQCVETYSLRKRWTEPGDRMLNQGRSYPSISTCLSVVTSQDSVHSQELVIDLLLSQRAALPNSSPLPQHNSGNFNQIEAQGRMANNFPHSRCFTATKSQQTHCEINCILVWLTTQNTR